MLLSDQPPGILNHNPSKYVSKRSSLTPTNKPLQWFGQREEIPVNRPGIWQVYRGIVQLSKINLKGEEVPLGWVVADNCFGIWLPQLANYRVKALTDSYLRWFYVEDLAVSPHLMDTVLTQLHYRRQQTEALRAIAGLRLIEERLQQLLLLLKQELGEPVAQGTRLKVRFTHQYLANAIGSSRVTVTRLLGEFKKQGLISLDSNRHIIVQDERPALNF